VKRLVLAILAALLTALGAVPSADAAAVAPKKREVVCFKKTVKTKSGRTVRRKVCRARRKLAPKVKSGPVMPGPSGELPPAIAPAPGTPAPTPTGTPAPTPVATPIPVPAAPVCVPEDTEWLTATALDVDQKFVLRLSRTCLRAGRTIVRLQNQDAQEHDLWAEGTAPKVARRAVTSAGPESMTQADVDLTAGEWRLFCSIPGHGNMSRTVNVVR
jgi:hypothetical protein